MFLVLPNACTDSLLLFYVLSVNTCTDRIMFLTLRPVSFAAENDQ